MANIFHIDRPTNKITFGTDATIIVVTPLTASKTLALNASKELESVQDIRTTASPIFVSVNSLYLRYTATGNIAIGDVTTLDALDTDPTHNIAIGNGAGSGITDGDNNIFIGYRAGYSKTTSGQCIAIGYEAAYSGAVIGGLTAIGYQAMKYHSSGNGNTCIGYQTGLGDIGGAAYAYNTFIGEMAGRSCNDGGSNVCLGKDSGQHLYDGSTNIFLGFSAGHKQVNNSNLLIVDNQERADVATELTNAILYGVMAATPAAQSLRINVDTLTVTGSISSGTLTVTTGAYDALDVTDVNTVFLDCSGGAITIGGFVGGVDGQHLCIARLCASAANMTLEHIEGTGNQDIYLHAGADEVLFTEYGGWVLVCNGTSWFDTSHAKHV